uniref:Uncharacterized protein n=1 Tax=Arundo donax TaxID=35708 RepID=A0A0A9DWD0_ARUDO
MHTRFCLMKIKGKTMTSTGMRRVTQDLMVEILGIVRVIHTSLVVVAPRPAISHLVMDGRQWVVREIQKHFPFRLVVTLGPAVETHLVLILVMFFPTFLLVGQREVASMVDQLARLEPVQELLVSILALSGLRMSPCKFSIKK